MTERELEKIFLAEFEAGFVPEGPSTSLTFAREWKYIHRRRPDHYAGTIQLVDPSESPWPVEQTFDFIKVPYCNEDAWLDDPRTIEITKKLANRALGHYRALALQAERRHKTGKLSFLHWDHGNLLFNIFQWNREGIPNAQITFNFLFASVSTAAWETALNSARTETEVTS